MVRVIRVSYHVLYQVDGNSFSSAPFCQKFDLYIVTGGGGGIFTDFRCGLSPLTQNLERSALASTSSSSSAPATSIASSSTPANAANTPTASRSKTGIIAGSVIGGAVALAVAVLVCLWFAFRFRSQKGAVALHFPPTHWEVKIPSESNINKDFAKTGSISESQLRTWRAFLSMYGKQGIVLRELMMLVSAIYIPVVDSCRHQHWSHGGEQVVTSLPSSNEFFLAVLNKASSEIDLLALEKKLEAHEIIAVREKDHFCMDRDWISNGRSWCALSSIFVGSVDHLDFSKDILAIYSQMPHRDVHPVAERYRELFYNHAHVAILGILPVAQEAKLDSATEALFCHVGLQVLSHRYQVDDSQLMKYLQGRVKRIFPGVWPLGGRHYHEIQQDIFKCVTFHLAELRRVIEQYERTKGRWYAVQPSLHDTEMFLSEAVHARSSLDQRFDRTRDRFDDKRNAFDHRAWGMIGFALVELMNATEVLQERSTFERVTRVTEIWRDKSMTSRSSVEMAALCCVLVRLRAFDELYRLPEEHYLSCGYYLARAGYLTLAEIFIAIGIEWYERCLPQVPMWRYHLELCGVKMRLGQWEETTRWLSSKLKSFDTIKNDVPGGTFMKNKSGEFGEYRLNLASLLTDCYIATNRFPDAMHTISEALQPVASMRDSFIRSIRVALRVRSMSLQLQIKDMHAASTSAVDLCRDLQDPVPLAAGLETLLWTVQEILACVDELMYTEYHGQAHLVLRMLTGWTDGQVPDQRAQDFEASLPDDLKDYAYQRWVEVNSMIELRRSSNAPESSNLASASLGIVPTSIDPTRPSVETKKGPLTTLGPLTELPAVSPKSSKLQHDVENQPFSLPDATDIPQGTPMQSDGPTKTGGTAQPTLAAAEIRPDKSHRTYRTRIRQGVRAGGSDLLSNRKNLRNLMMLTKLRKPPQSDPSTPIAQQHEPRELVLG